MKKKSKKFLILSISASLVLITGIILACADSGYEDFFNSFFAPETSGLNNQKPLFRSMNKFYGNVYYTDAIHAFDSTNLTEWHSFFKSAVVPDDLHYLVYTCRIGEIDTLIFYLKDNKYPAKPYLKKNTLLTFEDKAISREFLFYLGFAKRCEPFAIFNPEWWDDDALANNPRKDSASMQKLINGGKKTLANVKTDFIRQRYSFQIVRLLFNSGNYEGCLAWYQENLPVFTTPNSIKYRTLGYVAGAYYKLKKYSEANYQYAVLYDQCNEMKLPAFLSFHPQEEADWNASLQLAQTPREKAVLWHLLGVYADPLRAMKEIYAIDPKSDLLDLLLVRAVNIEEEQFIPNLYYDDDKNTSRYALKKNNVDNSLFTFLKKVADAGNSNKPYLWNLSAGYLCIAAGNYKQADTYLSKATTTGDKLVAEQIRAFRLISNVEQYNKPLENMETTFAKELTWLDKEGHDNGLRSQQMYQWALKRLSEKYASFGDMVKAQCLDYSRDHSFYDDPGKMNSLIAFIDKPQKTAFEAFMLNVHPYTRQDLFEYLAVNLVYQYKFREALAKFDECPGSGNTGLPADPFIIHINDCHDCDHEATKNTTYTKYTFVQRLAELSEFATGDARKASQKYFILANGLYNLTFFGNIRRMYQTRISGEGPSDFYFSDRSLADTIYDCTKAGECYRKAMEMSIDKEFKAKCAFMAAKCEQNQFFASGEITNDIHFKAGKYFKTLKENYSNTKYYQEIIKECGYFRTYLGVKK
jgi:hypothetical protein